MSSKTLRLAMAQTTSSNRHEDNIEDVTRIAQAAASQNARLLALPEAVGLVNRDRDSAVTMVTAADSDPFLNVCRELAKQYNLWIQAGSTPVTGQGQRFRNHATLISPDGMIIATYDKIHLFDVFLDGKPPTGESQRYEPGEEAVLADTPWGPMALTVCYDIRFPHLYRQHAQEGAVLAFAPSAFSVPTGKAHWEALLRARAIENGFWIVAAAQVGKHLDGRDTYGHSLIVSPWGEVLCDLGGDEPGMAVLDLDMTLPASARRQIPSLKNERKFRFKRIRRQQQAAENRQEDRYVSE